jgi:hypothetical protein
MKLQPLKCFLLFSCALLGLISCSRDGDFYYHVINDSGKELNLVIKRTSDSVPKKLVIMPKTEMAIAEIKDIPGGAGDMGNDFLKWFDSLSLAPGIDTLHLSKHIKDRPNWDFEGAKKKNNPESRYKFTVADSDIQ